MCREARVAAESQNLPRFPGKPHIHAAGAWALGHNTGGGGTNLEHGIPALVEAIINRAIDRWIPHRHAEVRPSRKWLMAALICAGFGALFVLASIVGPFAADRAFSTWIATAMLVFVIVCIAAYFRFRIHFRSFGVYGYRWGWRAWVKPYAGFQRVEMGYWAALKLVRSDQTFWNMPLPDHDGGLEEVIWRLRNAALPTPDDIALHNRFGIANVDGASRCAARQNPRRA